MKFNHLNWECGSGKTDSLLKHLASNHGLYVVALNKIDSFNQNQSRLATFAGASTVLTKAIHSQDGVKGLDVGARISDFIQSTNSSGSNHCVLFITQEALLLVDWRRQDLNISRWQLFIDEAPNPFKFFSRNFEISQPDILTYLTPEQDDDGVGGNQTYTRIQLTKRGDALRRCKKDALSFVLQEILNSISGARIGFANRSFFGISPDGTISTKLDVFSIIDPTYFSTFGEVTILAANFEQTFAYQLWGAMGVEFVHRTDFGTPSLRDTPLSERIHIHYFSNKDASLTWFRSPAAPLRVACQWINDNIQVPFYYTINQEAGGSSRLNSITSSFATEIQPIAAGSNELRDFTAAIWLAALKAPPQEYIMMEFFGVDNDDYDRFREHELLYQFALRSNLREFGSDKPVDVYVISKRQAEALQKITKAKSISKIAIDLPEVADNQSASALPTGRPRKYKSADESRQAKRDRDRAWVANKRKELTAIKQ